MEHLGGITALLLPLLEHVQGFRVQGNMAVLAALGSFALNGEGLRLEICIGPLEVEHFAAAQHSVTPAIEFTACSLVP